MGDAVAAAGSHDTITFACATDTISFDSGEVITIDKVLTINGGNAEDPLDFDGQQSTNFFIITGTGHLTVANVHLNNGAADNGGAIYIESGGSLQIAHNVWFNGNVASDFDANDPAGNGGAVYAEPGSSITATDAPVFYSNTAATDGGVIYLAGDDSETNSSLIMYKGYFQYNGTDDGDGGAIFSGPGNTVTLLESTFQDTNAFSGGAYDGDGDGGVIYVDGGELIIEYGTFNINVADGDGGVIYVSDARLDITRTNFSQNQAVGDGGVIAIDSDSEATIHQAYFWNNGATDDGGAIAIQNGATVDISRSTFDINSASGVGGAIATTNATLRINASTFYSHSSLGVGSTIYMDEDDDSDAIFTEISWSTIVQTGSADFEPALYLNSDLILTGVILKSYFGHLCDIQDGGTLTDSYTLSDTDTPTDDTSCGLTGTTSQENIDVGLAGFETVELNGQRYTYVPLENESPAIGAGPSTCDTDVQPGFDTDQLGNKRPYGTNCTIGAVEVNNVPPSAEEFTRSSDQAYEDVPVGISFFVSDVANETIEDGPTQVAIDCDINDDIDPISTSAGSFECTYPDNGTYEGILLISDDLATSTRPFTIFVQNVAPTMTAIDAASTTTRANEPITFQMHATDVTADTLFFVYSCGNGTYVSTNLIASDTGDFSAEGTCTYTADSTYTISVFARDDDAGISDFMSSEVSVISFYSTLCVDRWSGQLRYVDSGDCGRSETQIDLPDDAPISLCVNNWNGATRIGTHCSRSEHVVVVEGDGSIDICVNRWNGSMRVSDRCSRSETEREL